jgi:hypothetical protein
MENRIEVLQKGIEKKEMAAMACCSNPPTGKIAK